MVKYETYELYKVKQEMDFVAETVIELKTLLDLHDKELLSNLNEVQINNQLRDIKRALVNSWLILGLNEHKDVSWKLNND